MPLFVEQDSAAKALVIVTVVAASLGEILATYAGRARDAPKGASRLRAMGSSIVEATFLRSRGPSPADRGTKQLIVGSMLAAVAAAAFIAVGLPGLRVGSNDWAGVIVGVVIAWLGIGLRVWGVWTLGRFFRREVVIQEGQTVVREGPYHWLRHPAYAGNLLVVFGVALAIGSWIGAVVALAIATAGHLPRIRVEEAELTKAFGDGYRAYASDTARLAPGVW